MKYLRLIGLLAALGFADFGWRATEFQSFAADGSPQQEYVERNYLVKGMTCGGCVFGVKKALQRNGLNSDQILEVDYRAPDPKNKIGHAKVRFPKDQYKGRETDCRIVKEIRDNPGYVAYWDAGDPDPCHLNAATN